MPTSTAPVRLWRIAPGQYDPLTGEGARRFGGRWTSPGRPAVYLASSLPLAALEVLAHVDADAAPLDLVAVAVDIPPALGGAADWASWRSQTSPTGTPLTLPDGWRNVAQPAACRAIGDAWLRTRAHPLLHVPSAVLPAWVDDDAGGWCAVLDPTHPEASGCRVAMREPFTFDPRVLRRA